MSRGVHNGENGDKRTKEFRLWRDMLPPVEDLLAEEIDGVRYSYRREPRCKVCKLPEPLRRVVDNYLLWPMSILQVMRELHPLYDEAGIAHESRPRYDSYNNHKVSHLKAEEKAAREIVERRAKQQGLDIYRGTRPIITTAAILELVASRGFQAIAKGESQPSIGETVQAISALERMEREADQETSVADVMAQFTMLTEAVREVVPPEMWGKIMDRVDQIKAAYQLSNGHDQDIIDAEIVN